MTSSLIILILFPQAVCSFTPPSSSLHLSPPPSTPLLLSRRISPLCMAKAKGKARGKAKPASPKKVAGFGSASAGGFRAKQQAEAAVSAVSTAQLEKALAQKCELIFSQA